MDLEKLLHRDSISDRGISVVIAAHNEAECLEAVVSGVTSVLERMARGHEIIVVNDGSTDATGEFAERLITSNRRIRLVQNAAREGYGAALRSGFRVAKYPLVLQLDGDNQYDATELERFLGAIDHVDVVCGYRPSATNETGRLGYWLYRKLLRFVFAVHARDVDCGFRLFRRVALRRIPIQSTGRFANAEILAKGTFMNMLVGEVAVSCRPRACMVSGRPGESSVHVLREAAHVFRRPRFCPSNLDTEQSESSVHAA